MASFLVRLMEIIAVLQFLSHFIGGNIIAVPLFLYLLTTQFYFIPFLYFIWMYFDFLTPYRGGRRFECVRRFFLFRYLVSYFPIKLHKTAELDPTKNYMFCFHPHGVLSVSVFANFLTEANQFSQKFPGITIHPLTLEIMTSLPLYREYITALGCGAVRRDSINYKLTKLGEGHSIVIVIGGAAEAALSHPDNPYRVKLKGRWGFVREALIAGAPIVPVYSFGETEVFRQFEPAPGSLLDRIQKFGHRVFGFIAIVFYGPLPFFPYRKPINTVVGPPLLLPRIEKPTEDDIQKWHGKYIEALKELFASHKDKFGVPGKELELF